MKSSTSHSFDNKPSDWVTRFGEQIRAGGHVLDVAAGGGRHSRYFADRGYTVTALDKSVSIHPVSPGY